MRKKRRIQYLGKINNYKEFPKTKIPKGTPTLTCLHTNYYAEISFVDLFISFVPLLVLNFFSIPFYLIGLFMGYMISSIICLLPISLYTNIRIGLNYYLYLLFFSTDIIKRKDFLLILSFSFFMRLFCFFLILFVSFIYIIGSMSLSSFSLVFGFCFIIILPIKVIAYTLYEIYHTVPKGGYIQSSSASTYYYSQETLFK